MFCKCHGRGRTLRSDTMWNRRIIIETRKCVARRIIETLPGRCRWPAASLRLPSAGCRPVAGCRGRCRWPEHKKCILWITGMCLHNEPQGFHCVVSKLRKRIVIISFGHLNDKHLQSRTPVALTRVVRSPSCRFTLCSVIDFLGKGGTAWFGKLRLRHTVFAKILSQNNVNMHVANIKLKGKNFGRTWKKI